MKEVGWGRVPLGALAWLLLVVLGLTWTPFSSDAPEVRVGRPSFSQRDIVANLLLFALLATVLAGNASLADGRRKVIARVASSILLVSVVVEAGQLVVDGRTISTFDVLLNVTGATAAAVTVLKLREIGLSRGLLLFAVMFGSYSAVLLLLSVMQPDLRIRNWNPDFEIHAGDEVGGDRAYLGTVTSAQICTGEVGHEVCAGPGASENLRRMLATLAENSQRIVLSATVLPFAGDQSGPARIVTFSQGTTRRNATLAQTNESLVLRVRTPRTGPNGDLVEFRLPGAIASGIPTHVLAVYRPDDVVLSARSSKGTIRGRFVTGFPAGWWLTRPPPLPRKIVTPIELSRARLLGFVVLGAPIGMAIGWSRIPLVAALIYVVVGVAALIFLTAGPGGVALSVASSQLGIGLLAGMMGVVLGRVDRRMWRA